VALRVCGNVVDDPMGMWREYAEKHGRTVRKYDHGDRGDPNALTTEEAWRSTIIGSRLRYTERDEVVARAASAPWTELAADADLADADPTVPGGTFAQAACLYWTFTWPDRIRGVRVAKAHKILHIKRPRFYPILDDHIRRLYRPCALPWLDRLSHLKGMTAEDSPLYWAAFRDDLIRNQNAIDGYRTHLADDDDETVRLMATLTSVRLQDIIAWTIAPGPRA